MKRFYKKSLYRIFVSFFIIFYSFTPSVISISQLIGLSENGSLVATAQEATPVVTEPMTNDHGMCIEDAAGGSLNCTANDVSLSSVTGVTILDDGCQFVGDTVEFKAKWELQSTANERYDIGLYFATEGQSTARTGVCSVSTLPNSPQPPWYNYDNDYCGDLSSSAAVSPEVELTAVCLDPDGDNFLNLPYCTSWDHQSTQGEYCTGPDDAYPGTTSKCNCPPEGFTVPITVPYSAEIEVKKNLVPSSDSGTFNLYVDNRGTDSCIGDGGTTGKLTVGAGTSDVPGDTHIVGENVDGCGTSLDNYSTVISCVDRGLQTFNGGDPLTLTSTSPLTVPVDKDDDIVCTITNKKDTGSIKVNKLLDSDGNGSFETENPNTYKWILDGNQSTPYDMGTTEGNILIGSHTITETQIPNYSFVGWYPNTVGADFNCDNLPTDPLYKSLPANINVIDSSLTEITLCNAADEGHLIVQKTTYPSGDGEVFGISASTLDGVIDGGGSGTISDTSDKDYTVSVGTYSVSETVPFGWDLTSNTCKDIYVGPGQTEYCLITNTKRGNISGHKLNDPDGLVATTDGRTPVSGWTIELWKDGNKIDEDITDIAGVFSFENLVPGNYQLKEVIVLGWVQLSGLTIDVTLEPGENDSNNDFVNVKYPTITIFKNVDENGDGDLDDSVDVKGATNWEWDIDGVGDYSTGSKVQRLPGSYTISETQKTNYHVTSLECNNGETYSATESFDADLVSGQDLECTFTNTRDLGKLIVKKVVVNDNGGSMEADDFSFQIDGGDLIPFEVDEENEFVKYAGLSHSITEPQVSGYTTTYDNCTNLVIPYNGTVTCTITNNDVAPKLTLIKNVVNDNGGNALPNDFKLTVGGDTVLSGVRNEYDSNVAYTIDETQLTGYNFVSITGDEKCPKSLGDTVILSEGDDVTCTIKNDDIAPKLTVVKNVVNDNGGNAQPNDFNLTVGGGSVFSGVKYTYMSNTPYAINETELTGYKFVDITGDAKCPGVLGGTVTLDEGDDITCTIKNDDVAPKLTIIKNVVNDNNGNAQPNDFKLTVGGSGVPSGVTNEYDSNKAYAIDETQLTGYDFVSITGDSKCPKVLGGAITLDEGDDITCTIKNDDVAPKLTITKTVVNDDGGKAQPNDFKLTVGGSGVLSGVTNEYDSNTSYAIDETQLSGYEFEDITGDAKCPGVLGGTLTLDEGENISCTIENDDVAPTLKLVKKVDNDDGGLLDASSWLLSATGSERSFADSGDSVIFHTVKAGVEYTLTETSVSGYESKGWICDGGILDGNKLTLGLDEDVTCTVTNDDIAPKLTLVKKVITDNGGNEEVSDFSLFIDSTPAVSGVTYTLAANKKYVASELPVKGYVASVWGGDCSEDGSITLLPGDNKTCTITNDDIAPKLTLIKTVINDNGGKAVADDFDLTVGGKEVLSGSEHTYMSNTPYALNETLLSGYTFTSITGDPKCPGVLGGTVTLDEGDDITCTITNDDQQGKLIVKKVLTTDDNGNETCGDFDFTINGRDPISFESDCQNEFTLNSGEYTVEENQTYGYSTRYSNCTDVFVPNGGSATCTIYNNDIAPTITLIKELDINYGGSAGVDDFGLTIGATEVDSSQTLNVKANMPYELDEEGMKGYEFVSMSGSGCPSELGEEVTLNEGVNLVCTIVNTDLPGTIIVHKDVTMKGEGEPVDIYSDDIFDVTLDNNVEGYKHISDTQVDPQSATFALLNSGWHSISEIPLDGYRFDGCWSGEIEQDYSLREFTISSPEKSSIHVDNGETKEVTCYNEIVKPELEITKTNDSDLLGIYAGEYVKYTIIVEAPVVEDDGGTYILKDVKVMDIMPDGFKYVAGSWTSSPVSVPEPVYQGNLPAMWSLGDMEEGDVITLTYLTKVSLLQDPGLYKDIAYTYATSLISGANGDVLGISMTDNNTNFVGTEVLVIEEPGIDEGEVLGASIELPRTGAETYLTLGALISMILGFVLLVFNPKRKIKNLVIVAGVLLLGVFTFVKPTSTYAFSDINVQIEKPETPTNVDNFKIGFVALDIYGRPLEVQCYEGGVAFGPVYTANSGNCVVDSTIITTSGTYDFYVVAKVQGDTQSATSDTVSVAVDLAKPSPVTNYSKSEGTCSNTLTFKTANDGQTSKVQIFRSNTQPFTANASTLIKEMSVGPNVEVIYTDTPLPNCSTEYYYAIRSVDSFNNTSSFVTDDIVTVVIVPATPTTPTGTGTDTDQDGGVAGEEVVADGSDGTGGNGEEVVDENGEVAGETTIDEDGGSKDEEDKSFWGEYKYVIIFFGVVILSSVGYIYVKRRK